MTDFIIIIVLLVIIGLAAGYVIKAKKSGAKCIGCPHSKSCPSASSSSGCSCGCGGQDKA